MDGSGEGPEDWPGDRGVAGIRDRPERQRHPAGCVPPPVRASPDPARLRELAGNLFYSWDRRTRALFCRIDAVQWERCEPCGLAQLNAMRYGTIPLVHATGGLAETMTDATTATLAAGTATGFRFEPATADALAARCRDAADVFRQPPSWRRLVTAAMQRDSSWATSAAGYAELYRQALRDRLQLLA